MRNVRSNILKALLAFFGMNLFTSCYGMLPVHYYEISGSVEDQQHRPIPGILVTPQDRVYNDRKDTTDVIQVSEHGGVLTDSQGKFRLQYRDYGGVVLTVKDIDGSANGGEFESKTIVLDDNNLTCEHPWYDDTHRATGITITLEKKKD